MFLFALTASGALDVLLWVVVLLVILAVILAVLRRI